MNRTRGAMGAGGLILILLTLVIFVFAIIFAAVYI